MATKKHCDLCDKVIESNDRYYDITIYHYKMYEYADEHKGIICIRCSEKPIRDISF